MHYAMPYLLINENTIQYNVSVWYINTNFKSGLLGTKTVPLTIHTSEYQKKSLKRGNWSCLDLRLDSMGLAVYTVQVQSNIMQSTVYSNSSHTDKPIGHQNSHKDEWSRQKTHQEWPNTV